MPGDTALSREENAARRCKHSYVVLHSYGFRDKVRSAFRSFRSSIDISFTLLLRPDRSIAKFAGVLQGTTMRFKHYGEAPWVFKGRHVVVQR